MKKKVKRWISIMAFVFAFMGMMKATDVYAAAVESARIVKNPDRTTYYSYFEQNQIDLTGAVIELTYSDGITEKVSYGEKTDIIYWNDAQYMGTYMEGEYIEWYWEPGLQKVYIPIVGLARGPEFEIQVEEAESTAIQLSEELTKYTPNKNDNGWLHVRYTPSADGFYTLWANQTDGLSVYQKTESGLYSQVDSTGNFTTELEAKAVLPARMKANQTYVFEIHKNAGEDITLAVKPDSVEKAEVVPYTSLRTEYISGYDQFLDSNFNMKLTFHSGVEYEFSGWQEFIDYPQYRGTYVEDTERWEPGENQKVVVPIEGLEESKWPFYTITVKDENSVTDVLTGEVTPKVLNKKGYTYFKYIPETSGIYAVLANNTDYVSILHNYDNVSGGNASYSETGEVSVACNAYLEAGEAYLISYSRISDLEQEEKVSFAVREDKILGAEFTQNPAKKEYISNISYGVDSHINMDRAEIIIKYALSGDITYSTYSYESRDLIDWYPKYTGDLDEDNRWIPGSYDIKISIKGTDITPTFSIEVKETKDLSRELTDSFEQYFVVSGDNYFKYTPSEDGFYALLADKEGICTYYEDSRYITSFSWNDLETSKPVGAGYMEAGKTYLINIWSSNEKTVTLALQKDEFMNAEVSKFPDKINYIAGLDDNYIDLQGIEITLNYKESGSQTYSLWNGSELIDWENYICEGWTEDGIEKGPHKVYIPVKGLTEEKYPYFEIQVYEIKEVVEPLPEEPTEKEIGSGKYFTYTASETGYYGLLSEEAGEIRIYDPNGGFYYDSWNNTDGQIKKLLYLEKNQEVVLQINGAEKMTLAMCLANVEEAKLNYIGEDSFPWNTNEWLLSREDYELTFVLNNGDAGKQEYILTDTEKYIYSIQAHFEQLNISENGEEWLSAGNNKVVVDCHLKNNPFYNITIDSIENNAKSYAPIGTAIGLDCIHNEWDEESYHSYCKVKVDQTGWYRFGIQTGDIETGHLYDATNRPLGRSYGDGGTYRLEAGKTYVLYCTYVEEGTELLVSEETAKSITIDTYRNEYLQGVEAGEYFDPLLGLVFTVTYQDGTTRTFYGSGDEDEYWPNYGITIRIDGQEWVDTEDFSTAPFTTPGKHSVELEYLGAAANYSYTVNSFDEYVKSLDVLEYGDNPVADDIERKDYWFTPEKTGYYHVSVSDDMEGEYYISYYDENGWLEDLGMSKFRTVRLIAGKNYLFRYRFYDGTSNTVIHITKQPEIQEIIVKTPPKEKYIARLEYEYEETLLRQAVFTVRFKNEDGTITDQDTNWRYDGNFDLLDFTYTLNEEIDWSRPGTYTLTVKNEESKFEKNFPIRILSTTEAEENGLIKPISVGNKSTIVTTNPDERRYYRLDGIKDGDCWIRGTLLSTVNENEDGEAYLTLFSERYDEEGAQEWWTPGKENLTIFSGLSEFEKYYISLTSRESQKDWEILVEQKEITNITITKEQTKKVYYDFERNQNLNGMEVTVTYSDSDSEVVPYGSQMWNELLRSDISWEDEEVIVTIQLRSNHTLQDTRCYPIKPIGEYPSIKTLSRGTQIHVEPGERYYVFAYTPSATERYTFESDSNMDMYCELYEGETYLKENDDGGSEYNFCISEELVKGEVYYFVVREYNHNMIEESFYVLLTGSTVSHEHVFDNWVVTKEATCTEDGEKVSVCEKCDEQMTDIIPATGHKWEEDYTVLYEATCTEDGSQYRKCMNKGCTATETERIPAIGHEYEDTFTIDIEPKETIAGSKSRHCKHCDAKTDITVIPATGEGNQYQNAEHVKEELKDKNISDWTEEDKQKVQDIINQIVPKDSNPTENAKEIQANLDMDTVSDLEKLYMKSNSAVDKSDVNYTESIGEVTVEGAALTVGNYVPENVTDEDKYHANLEMQTLTSDKVTDNEELSTMIANKEAYVLNIKMSIRDSSNSVVADNIQPVAPIRFTIPLPEGWEDSDFILYHYTETGKNPVDYVVDSKNNAIIFTAVSFSYYSMEKKNPMECKHENKTLITSKEATCTELGYKNWKCTECGATWKEVQEVLGHELEEEIIKESTCGIVGEKHIYCTRDDCEYSRDVVIPVTGVHNYKQVTKEATCTEDGETYKECSVCHKIKDRETVAKLNHSYEMVIDKPATCKETGSQHEKCTRCGAEKAAVSIPKTNDHKYSSWITVAPTCTEGGYDSHTCSVCGKVEKENEKSALGHNYQEVVDKAATCVVAGSKHNECTRCHDKQTAVTIPATGHNFGDWVVTEGNCTVGGKKTRTCINCGTKEEIIIPATGHNFGDWEVTKNPTALIAGQETHTCEHCGISEQREVAKLTPIIKLSATKLPLQIKKSTTALKVTAMQKGDKIASFTSSNPKIVKVHKTNGKLTALKKIGKATILVKLRSGKTAKCIVTVQKGKVTTKSIKLSAKKLTLKKGKTAKLTTVLNPLTSQDKVTFTTSNKKIATVTSKGVIKAKKKGTAKITAKSGKKKVVCVVTVK